MLCLQDVQTKVADVVLGKDKPLEESNPEYEKLKHYVDDLEDHLAEAQKQSFRLVKRQRGKSLSCSLGRSSLVFNFTFCFENLSSLHLRSREANRASGTQQMLTVLCCDVILELGQGLTDFGKAVKSLGDCEGGSLGKAFSGLGSQSDVLSVKLQLQVRLLARNLTPS